jgi:hypothetical protein
MVLTGHIVDALVEVMQVPGEILDQVHHLGISIATRLARMSESPWRRKRKPWRTAMPRHHAAASLVLLPARRLSPKTLTP